MKTQQLFALLASLVFAGLASAPSWAQSMDHDMAGHAAAVAADPATSMTAGEVRKIDKENGTITLKHGAIENLDMPGMTMVFRVADKTMLDPLKAGDKVKFRAASDKGQIVVTDIVPVQ